jgi:hypothetical protein
MRYSSALILVSEELEEITGKRRFSAQAKALAMIGISYKLRPDGFPLVSRTHFEQIMGGASKNRDAVIEPDWSLFDAAT